MNTKRYSYQIALVLFLALVTVIISGCGATLPTVADGVNAMQDRVSQQSAGRIRLSNFQEGVGSHSWQLEGAKNYNLAFLAEIEFVEDCKWLPQSADKQIGFSTEPRTGATSAAWEYKGNPAASRLNVKKGQKAQLVGEITFFRYHDSWYTGGLSLDKAELLSAPTTPLVKH